MESLIYSDFLKILYRCYANFKHDEKSIRKYKNACEEIFQKIYKLEKKGTLEKKLEGPVKQMGFKRLT